MKPKLGIHAKDISLYINCVFYSGRMRTLVATATYSNHRLIKEKVEIFNFCQVISAKSLGIFEKKITEIFIE